MTAAFALVSILEIIVVGLLIFGFIHEDKVIAFEDRLALALARFIKARRAKKQRMQADKRVQSQRRAEVAATYDPQQEPQSQKRKKDAVPHRVA